LEIIRDGSTAIATATTGYEFPKAELERLVREGYLEAGALEDFVKDSFAFGQLMQQRPAAKQMSYADFQKHIKANPVVMSAPERQAYGVASQRAGLYCVGLGSRYSEVAGQAIIEHDEKLATRLRTGIKREVSEAVARRETVGQLKTRLGQMAGEWERDWGRVAATESQMAHQEGFLGSVVERHGDDELLAKIPEDGACPHCLRLYLDAEGRPAAHPASWWYEQGTSNAGRKAADWKPVLGAIHPWCRCALLRVPAGWEFDEEWNLVPADEAEKAQVADGATLLEKARRLQGRLKWNGFDISIENRKGSVRRWYDPHTDTEGETKMVWPYGYLKMTEGLDSDHIDVFVGPHEDAPRVYVVNQMKAPSFRELDEQKVMLGFRSAKAAKRAYLQHFDQPGFFGSMTTMTVDAFRDKVFSRKGVMIKGEQLGLDFTASPKPKAPPRSAGGPFIGPRGGRWKDAQHTIPWEDPKAKKRERGVKVPPPGVITTSYLKAMELGLIKIASQPAATWEEAIKIAERAKQYAKQIQDDLLYTRGLWMRVGPSKTEKVGVKRDAAKLQEAFHELRQRLDGMVRDFDRHRRFAEEGRAEKLNPGEETTYSRLVQQYGGGDHDRWVRAALKDTREGWQDAYREHPGTNDEVKAMLKPLMRAARALAKGSEEHPRAAFARQFKVGDLTIAMEDEHRRLPAILSEEERSKLRHPMKSADIAVGMVEARRKLSDKGLGHLWHGAIQVRPEGSMKINVGPSAGQFAGGYYWAHPDKVFLLQDNAAAPYIIVHELGHRYWFRHLSSEDRERFRDQFGKVEATTTYGTTNPEEDFAEAFAAYVMEGAMTRDQVDRFKTYLGKSLEPIDEVAAWQKAVQAVGIRPEDFGLVVKYARQGHPEARKALDAVYAELGKGFPIEHASTRPETVGTMGHHSRPARTAGENVRSHRNAPPQDYPMGRQEMKRKGRRPKDKDKPRAADKLDVAGHTQGRGGWAHGYDADAVGAQTRGNGGPQDRIDARENLETQQRSRQALREGSKISDLEIHR
jgi:hypothetical protein